MREMVVAIRTGKKTAVRVMNYKRDGSTFLNSVMLSPVHDETGAYRFSIGVLSDAENSIGDGPALAALCAALPKTMQAASQPPAFDPEPERGDRRGSQQAVPLGSRGIHSSPVEHLVGEGSHGRGCTWAWPDRLQRVASA